MSKLDLITEKDVVWSDDNTFAVLSGYAKLLHALVFQTLHPVGQPKPNNRDYDREMKRYTRLLQSNRDFAHTSKLLHHFCDIYDLSIDKVRIAILQANPV